MEEIEQAVSSMMPYQFERSRALLLLTIDTHKRPQPVVGRKRGETSELANRTRA